MLYRKFFIVSVPPHMACCAALQIKLYRDKAVKYEEEFNQV